MKLSDVRSNSLRKIDLYIHFFSSIQWFFLFIENEIVSALFLFTFFFFHSDMSQSNGTEVKCFFFVQSLMSFFFFFFF